MFSLISGIWKWLTSKTELRFLILGLDNSGKTTTLELLKRIYPSKSPKVPLDKIVPTIGLNLCQVDFDRSTSGVFWDLGGQLMLRGIWENHYNECDGMIFIIDSTDVGRFDEVKSTLTKIMNHPILLQREIPLAILLNKQDDAEHAASMRCILEVLGLTSLMIDRGYTKSLVISYHSPCHGSLQISSTEQKSSPFLSHVLSSESAGPTIACVAACSAIENINIKPAIDYLVCEAKCYSKLEKDNEGKRP